MAEDSTSDAKRAITVPDALGLMMPHIVQTLPVVSEVALLAAGMS